MKARQRYVAVNGAWPKDLPALTAAEAKRAFRALYRYRFGKAWRGKVRVVNGRRRRTYWGRLAPDAGWHDFIHDLSHDFHSKQYPGQKAHKGSAHAAVEKDMVEFVVNSGWLDGRLKAKPKAVKPKVDVVTKRSAAVDERVRKLETRLKRLTTALKKAKKQQRYYSKPRPERPMVERKPRPSLKQQIAELTEKTGCTVEEDNGFDSRHIWVGAPEGLADTEADPFSEHYVDNWREVLQRLKVYEQTPVPKVQMVA